MSKRQGDEAEEHKGYITFVSPKKKTSTGGWQFNINLQNSPTTPVKVCMFGEEKLRQAERFRDQKSPVKMRLTWNDRYSNYQLQDREGIRACNNMEVDFRPNPDLAGYSGIDATSVSIPIAQLLTMPLNNSKYFTVQGVIVLGKQDAFLINDTVVKEDVVVVGTSAHIPVKVWGEKQIDSLRNRQSYIVSHLKVRKSSEGNYMTTTPLTEITVVTPPLTISVPSTRDLFPQQIEVYVLKPKRLGRIQRFYSCENVRCKKKMDNVFASTKGPVNCQNCDSWTMKDDLSETVMIGIHIKTENSDIELTANKKVLSAVVLDWENDTNIAASLLSLRNFTLTYSAISKMVLELRTEEENSYDDFFSEDNFPEQSNLLTVQLVDNTHQPVESQVQETKQVQKQLGADELEHVGANDNIQVQGLQPVEDLDQPPGIPIQKTEPEAQKQHEAGDTVSNIQGVQPNQNMVPPSGIPNQETDEAQKQHQAGDTVPNVQGVQPMLNMGQSLDVLNQETAVPQKQNVTEGDMVPSVQGVQPTDQPPRILTQEASEALKQHVAGGGLKDAMHKNN